MTPRFFNPNHTKTAFVQLDTKKCKACWKCIDICHAGVMGKVDLPWHNHALVKNPANCSGCFSCLNECPSGALTEISKTEKRERKDTRSLSFIINLCLIIVAAVMVFSGFMIQIGYHMGNHGEIAQEVEYFGLNYFGWSDFHKISIVAFSVLIAFHTILHWKWYKNVIRKTLVSKNMQVIVLSVLFFLVAFTGFSSWMIHLANGSEMLRKFFIELHDKLTLFLFIFLILHIAGRLKWFVGSVKRMKIGKLFNK